VLNRVDPTMIALGTNYVYTTTDANAASDRLVLTNLGTPFATIAPGTNNEITALAYGTNDNPNALIAGANNGRLYLSTTGAPGSLAPTAYSGGTPTSVVFDNRAQARFFAVDQTSLWGNHQFRWSLHQSDEQSHAAQHRAADVARVHLQQRRQRAAGRRHQ
jgi:hypothetical protein